MTDATLSPWLDQVRFFIAEVARPFAIIVSSLSAGVATVIIAWRVDGFDSAAIFIGAVFAGVGGLYGAKTWEILGQAKSSASVEIAKAATPSGPMPQPPPPSIDA